MKIGVFGVVAAATWLAIAATAGAHTSYLKPNLFSTADAESITLESSFTENFLNPEIAVESHDFHFYRPDGERGAYDHISVLRQLTILEASLPTQGTYRFTTGERLGRTGLQVLTPGAWRPLEPGAQPPAGAQTRQSQTATVADVYVTKGAPTSAVLGVSVGRLAIQPITHPSEIYLDSVFRFRVLFDGVPAADQEVHLYRDGGAYDATPFEQIVRTGAQGEATLHFAQPGVYLLMTRKSGASPAGAATPVRSYTTSLTFEVTR
ncbi:MAG: DUF4198 domain-containing protein [Terricaulis sp.]